MKSFRDPTTVLPRISFSPPTEVIIDVTGVADHLAPRKAIRKNTIVAAVAAEGREPRE